jgi:hypothetical protein
MSRFLNDNDLGISMACFFFLASDAFRTVDFAFASEYVEDRALYFREGFEHPSRLVTVKLQSRPIGVWSRFYEGVHFLVSWRRECDTLIMWIGFRG